ALAVQTIKAGEADIILAGGTENMSQAPYLLKDARWGNRMGDKVVEDYMIKDGLWDVFNDYHMGITAENIAEQWKITREEQDELALNSELRAEEAIKSGRFKDEIVPVEVPQRRGEPIVVDTDEHPRFGSTIEGLGKLRQTLKRDETVTEENDSRINDGTEEVIVMSKEKAEELGIEPLATIVSYASAGVDPKIMGTGPIPASKKALEKVDLTIEDI